MGGLDSMIEDLQRLGEFDAELGKAAAPAVEEALKASAAAGTTPEGQAWAPKKSGGRAMANAAKAIAVKAYPGVLRVVLTGVEVFHHYGKGLSEVRRRIIPDTGTIPDVVARALKDAADKVFRRLVGGAS